MNVHLVTVVGGYVGVLPHMLAHYQALGIQSFFVHVHLNKESDPVLGEVKEVTRRFGCDIASVTVGEWLHNTNRELYRTTLESRPDDWFLIADQDEFQVYPGDLIPTLEDCDRRGYEYIEGCFLDRVARDGSFPAVLPNESIWRQFPLAGLISGPLLHANPNKVVAAKGRIKLGPGQHFALSGAGCPPEDLYVPVHHFKWVQGILERLEQRAEFRRQRGDRYWEESRRFVDHCRVRDGRLDIDDRPFHLAEALPEHPQWEELKQLSVERAQQLK